MNYKYNAPWHPLKTVCLGKSYSPDFYKDIKNSQIRDILTRIATETEEDYKNIETILTQLGITVLRPHVANDSILNHVDVNGKITHNTSKSFTLIPKPPMQPRDCQLVVNNSFLATNGEIANFMNILDSEQISIPDQHYSFDAPLVTVIGKDLIVDRRDHPWLDSFISEKFPDHRITAVDIGGHNDAVFAPVKPGVIVSTYHHTNYNDTFPGWEVLYIENQSWSAVPDWRRLKHSNQGKWWMPGEETNHEFTTFVKTWLDDWLGYVEETVFDVNMLVIDEHTVLVNNYNRTVFDFLEKHGVEPIVAPFRHRFFWDGGIHCITSDLYREGEPETYIKR
jgi:hypothetical protein